MDWWTKAKAKAMTPYQHKLIEKIIELTEVAMATQDQINQIADNFKTFVADVQRVLNDVIANPQSVDASALQAVSDNASTLETQLDTFDPQPPPAPTPGA